MVAGVVSVGGKAYAVGLYWQVSDTPSAAKAAKVAARQPGAFADFFCVRAGSAKGRAPQFGLGEHRLGHRWNMPSAAASLANRQPGSWAGVFVVPEGVWFIEVRDDLIAPEGDLVFADEAEAMGRLQEASARGGLEKIYAPASWAIPGAESRSLTSLLSGSGDARLRPVKLPPKVVKAALGGGVGLVLLIIAIFVVSGILEQRRQEQQEEEQRIAQEMARKTDEQRRQESEKRRVEEEERRRQAEEARAQAQAAQMLQMPWFQRAWESAPRPLVWLAACRDAMDKVQVAPLGWSLTSVVCSGSRVTAAWGRTSGPAVIPEGSRVDPSMRSATAMFDLAPVPARGAEEIWPADAVMVYTLQNDWDASLSYMPDEQPPALSNGQHPPPPPWVKRQVQWTVPLSPWTLKGPLVDLPGFVLNTLTRGGDGSWQMEGVLYEQRR